MRFQTLLLLAASGGATAASPPTRPTVTVSSGVIHGVSTNLPKKGATVNKFLGVPYAAPPARFERPTFPEPWKKPFKATKFGPACLQNFGLNEIAPRVEVLQELFNTPKPPESEDCLSINIFAPVATLAKAPRAVLVFIPGGGFQLGSGRSDLSAFAAYEDIIAVSFNYRTNVFGFPSSQDIPITERNLGLYDQRLALEWIQQNIASFGGDPSKVTIWGESAGAFSVDFHLKAYANDLPLPFRAAIPSSGQTSFGFAALTPNPRDDSGWLALAEAVGCKTGSDLLKCMKKASSKKLVDAMFKQKISFSPQLDGVTVLGKPAELWRTGQVARVPILTGTIWEEGRALVNDKVNLTTFLAVYLPFPPIYKETTDAIVAVYRSDPRLKTDFDIAAAILTDFFWACPQSALANAAAANKIPAWRYNFNASVLHLLPEKYNWLGKFHGSEILLLFSDPGTTKHTPQSYAVYEFFRGAIGRFVRNPSAGPGWSAVGPKHAPLDTLVIGDVGNDRAVVAGLANTTLLETRCGLYKDIYPIFE